MWGCHTGSRALAHRAAVYVCVGMLRRWEDSLGVWARLVAFGATSHVSAGSSSSRRQPSTHPHLPPSTCEAWLRFVKTWRWLWVTAALLGYGEAHHTSLASGTHPSGSTRHGHVTRPRRLDEASTTPCGARCLPTLRSGRAGCPCRFQMAPALPTSPVFASGARETRGPWEQAVWCCGFNTTPCNSQLVRVSPPTPGSSWNPPPAAPYGACGLALLPP